MTAGAATSEPAEPGVTEQPSSLSGSLRQLYPYARAFVPLLALGLVTAIGATLVKLSIPQALQRIVNDSISTQGTEAALWIGVGVVALLGGLEALLVWARRRLVIPPGTRLEADLRVKLYEHLTDLPPAFHDDWSGGQLLARSISDIRRFRRWLSFGMVMICVNTVTIVVGITLMIVTSPVLGLIFLAAALPAFLLSLRIRQRYRVLARRSQDQTGDLGATVEESVHGIRVLKAYGRELESLRDFSDQAEELKMTEIGKGRQRALMSLIMIALPDTAIAAIVVVGLFQVAQGSLTAGALLAFFATAALISGPLERISEQFAMSMEAKTAIDRFFEVLDHPNAIADPDEPADIPDGPGRVEFDRVWFDYPGHADRPVLRDASFEFEPGRITALVGLTGSGKSTVAQAIGRFYDVTGGAVRIDGVDIRDLRRTDVRSLVSIAFEEPILFSASVRENVAFGRPDATDEQITEALDVAQAHFVEDLPAGLDTRIGEEGFSLSGGQRQRLSLARAILPRPRILVLDDPLSALDVHTEAAVAARLRTYLFGTTTLLVANRPATARIADRIAVLHEGTVLDVGTHDDLIRRSPVYRRIVTAHDVTAGDDALLSVTP